MPKIHKGCDHDIDLKNVKKKFEGTYLNGGTATYTLYKRSDSSVLATGSLTYVPASNGRYRATIDRTITNDIVIDEWYDLKVVFSESGWDLEVWQELLGAKAT